jgi:hypothetical protein
MNLSKSFTLEELIHSNTAIEHKLDNTPTTDITNNLKLLCEHVLQPLRDGLNKPIKINCGYRSPAVNKSVGGAETSQHLYGQAADLDNGTKNREIFDYIKTHLTFDQLILEGGTLTEPAWIHVSYSSKKNRGEVLTKIAGAKTYSKF